MSCGCGCSSQPKSVQGMASNGRKGGNFGTLRYFSNKEGCVTPTAVYGLRRVGSFGPPPSFPANPYAPMWKEVGMSRVGRVGNDIFGEGQMPLVSGVKNEYLAIGAVALLGLFMAMR